MASVSRGWSIDNAKTGLQKFYWSIGAIFGHLAPSQIKPTLFDFRKGSPFIVQTRLRWLEYCKQNKSGNRVKLIQFLGTVDEVVPPNDTIDFSTEFTGTSFMQIEVPNTDHSSIIKLTESSDVSDQENQERIRRRNIIEAVLKGRDKDYKRYEVRRDQLVDELPPEPNLDIKNLVFVVHGIRDQGYWTKKVAGRIKNRAISVNLEFASRTPSYGYFPILPFLLPWYRRQKVEWLMDSYVEAAATYPNADIHYMGHSNGTYLCARALLDYPTVSFKHIMFAGSVVRPDFPWQRLVRVGKVSKIFNALATADLVVAVFPHGLRHLQEFFDLGGAGHVGFEEKGIPNSLFQLDTGTKQAFVKGGHSAAREETLWDEIADFIVAGQQPNSAIPNHSFVDEQPWISRILGKCAPALVYILASGILGIGAFLIATNLLIAVMYFYILRFMALRF